VRKSYLSLQISLHVEILDLVRLFVAHIQHVTIIPIRTLPLVKCLQLLGVIIASLIFSINEALGVFLVHWP